VIRGNLAPRVIPVRGNPALTVIPVRAVILGNPAPTGAEANPAVEAAE
jgi:hypothetical protein